MKTTENPKHGVDEAQASLCGPHEIAKAPLASQDFNQKMQRLMVCQSSMHLGASQIAGPFLLVG